MLGSYRFIANLTYCMEWLEQGIDLIYPHGGGCALCGRLACTCTEKLLDAYRSNISCPRCGKFTVQPGLCQDCGSRGEGFPERVWALAPYEGRIRDALHRFKYQGDKRCGVYLARVLSMGPGGAVDKPDLIVPVPLHPTKLRIRGYNQAHILAKNLARALKVPLRPEVLQRVAYTQPQADLGRQARLSNLSKAFSVPAKGLQGRTVLLVDDIMTTGFTLEACGIALRAAGIAGLQAVCVAAGREGSN